MSKITIAIDGYSSTGKSTLAKQLAKALNYIYVDSGAMYRAVTYFALQKGFITEILHSEALISELHHIMISFEINKITKLAEVYLNGVPIEQQIRTLEVSKWVSPIAAIPEVRKKLVQQQQEMGQDKGIVMDGRDIGTVVFPDAELKLFMTATPEVRAKRRFIELKERGENVSYKDVLNNVITRDKIDTTRQDSPLVKAKNAIEIDNSNMSIEAQLQSILIITRKLIANDM